MVIEMSFVKYVRKNKLGIINLKLRFKDITTMRVGGKIKCVFYPTSIEGLVKSIDYLVSKKIKYVILGNGSNIVASDRVYKGVVIIGKYICNDIVFSEDRFHVSAFTDLRKIVKKLVNNKIDSLTHLAGVPATVGGGLYMNCGANKLDIYENLIDITYLIDGKIVTTNNEDVQRSYRWTMFSDMNVIILFANFKIVKSDNCLIKYHDYLYNRKINHPIIYPNSGSIFRNNNDIKAYEIILKLNMSGYIIGGAQISKKHANFIVNLGYASGKDVHSLIQLVKQQAKCLNYDLHEEVIFINF